MKKGTRNFIIVLGLIAVVGILAFVSMRGNASQMATLYKGSVEAGNGIVSFISWNDPDGKVSMAACEDLKEAYARKSSGNVYECSTEVFGKYKPVIK